MKVTLPFSLRFQQKATVHKVGARPGTLRIPEGAAAPAIQIVQYSETGVSKKTLKNIDELDVAQEGGVTWVDIKGIGNARTLQKIAERFSIHPLILEDMVNVPQLPKISVIDDSILWISRMVRQMENGEICREQLSIYSRKNTVLTIQEHASGVLNPVRERIDSGRGSIRTADAHYLAYCLIDTCVDALFPICSHFNEQIDILDGYILEDTSPQTLVAINEIKLGLSSLHRLIRPQRIALKNLIDNPKAPTDPSMDIYLQDVFDHTNQLTDLIEHQRDVSTNLLNTHLSVVGYRTNEVMKVLTIMASIFIPLTFIAGVYGMNFQRMPELSLPWGYPAALGLMGAVAVGMVTYFVRKGWLGWPSKNRNRFK